MRAGALTVAGLGAVLWTVPVIAPDPPERGRTPGVPRAPGPTSVAASEPVPRTSTLQSWDDFNAPYDGKLHFVRVRYATPGRGLRGFQRGRGEPPWQHDWPRAEQNFLSILDELTFIGPQTEGSNILTTDHEEIFRYPILYIVEVGLWNPSDDEVEGLREYLLKGGFLIVDDFRDDYAGGRELQNFEFQMSRVLPGANLVTLDNTHEIFDSFFRIDLDSVIPPYGRSPPVYLGIFEDNDRSKRLQVIVNYNNDIAEYWEYSDRGWYPIALSNEAYKLGVNYIVYGLTH